MSFGYGVGDVMTVGKMAWKLYKSCKDAPASFQNISAELLSMHAVLKEVEDIYTARPLGNERGARLKIILNGCSGVLHDLQLLVDRYQSLGSGERHVWESLKYPTSEIPEYRSRLTSNIALLNTFISTSQVFVEQKLDQMKRELQRRGDNASIRSAYTVDSLSMDDRQAWRKIRKELEVIGITIAAFDANRDFILDWLRKEVATDDIGEQPLEDVSKSSLEYIRDNHLDSPSSSEQVIAATTTAQIVSNVSQSEGRNPTEQAKPRNRMLRYIQRLVYIDRALFEAVQRGEKDKIEKLVGSGADVNARDAQKRTPLHVAAIFGSGSADHAKIAELLIRHGADIEAREKDDNTPLNEAAGLYYCDTLQVLLNHGADVNTLNKFGDPPLSKAIIPRTMYNPEGGSVVQRILRAGADANFTDTNGWSLLHRAASYGDAQNVELLIEHQAEVDAVDNRGRTPLFTAAGPIDYAGDRISHAYEEDYAVVVRVLLKNGADINRGTDGVSQTPLHLASWTGCNKIVEVLVNAQANPDLQNDRGETALHLAVLGGQIKIAEAWLHAGANPGIADQADRIPLDVAERDDLEKFRQIFWAYSEGRNSRMLASTLLT